MPERNAKIDRPDPRTATADEILTWLLQFSSRDIALALWGLDDKFPGERHGATAVGFALLAMDEQ